MLDVTLLGDITIRRDETVLPAPPAKVLELLCYLLVHREQAHSREQLAQLLWPDGDYDVSRRYLRQSLWRLNAKLGPATGAHLTLIAGQDRVRINLDAVRLDLGVFEHTHAATVETPGRHLAPAQVARMQAAVALYQGDLMASAGYDWISHERDRVRLAYLAMLEQLMDHCAAHRLFTRGMRLGQVVLRLDPARESAHRGLMRLCHGAGDRVAALRQFEQCARILAEEFGIEPSAETVALYRQIRAGGSDGAVAPRPATVGPAALAELHARLDQIQRALTTLQESITPRLG